LIRVEVEEAGKPLTRLEPTLLELSDERIRENPETLPKPVELSRFLDIGGHSPSSVMVTKKL